MEKIYFYHSDTGSIMELGGSKPRVVAEEIESGEDGDLMAAAPQLLRSAQLAEKAFEWMLVHVNLKTLPRELQPLSAHLEYVKQSIRKSQHE